MDVGSTDVLVTHRDGGRSVDIVLSRIRGNDNAPMGLREMEALTDRVIRYAWKAMTGKALPRGIDPVEFINSDSQVLTPRLKRIK